MDNFHDLLADRRSGSTEILLNFLHTFIQNRDNLTRESFSYLLDQLSVSFQNMTVIEDMITKLHGQKLDDAVLVAKHFILLIEKKMNTISSKASKVIKGRVLTFSNSYTLYQTLSSIELSSVNVLRSSPGEEGEVLYSRLLNKLENVQMIDDDKMEEVISSNKIDFILLGSDSYSYSYFVNKVGSKLLCNLAMKYKIPVIVLCTKEKFHDFLIVENKLLEKIPFDHNIILLTD